MRLAAKVPFYVAVLIAGLAFAITVRDNGFVAPFTDPSGYVSAGARWLRGEIQEPVHFQFQPQFPHADTMGSPLGYRPGAIKGTDVVEYPLGLPVFIAAAMALFGEIGAHLVAPICAALLALSTYGLGAALAGPWAGVIAALIISASPVTMRHSVYVSSDVPCAAFWALAWLMSLTPRTGAAAAAGAAVTAAVMIRPNTAPLAAVMGVVILFGGAEATLRWRAWRWRNAAMFTVMAAIGPSLVLWSNTLLYGGPFEAGYKGAAEFFRWAHVAPNLKLYPAWLFEVHSMASAAALLAVPIALWRAWRVDGRRREMVMALSALAMMVVNLALIVAYLNFQQWTYLRFVLPGMAALFVLMGALVVWTVQALAAWRPWLRWAAPVAAIPAVLAVWQGVPETRGALQEWRSTRSVLLMGHYLREALPPNAVVLSFMHSGTVALFVRQPIVRLDIIQPDLDGVIARLRSQGYRPVLVLDEVIESPHMARIFPSSVFNRLDWPPRASFTAYGRIWYLDPADRDAYRSGTRYATDVLR